MGKKIDDIIKEEMKDPEFAKEFKYEEEKTASALALYYAREKVRLTQLDANNTDD